MKGCSVSPYRKARSSLGYLDHQEVKDSRFSLQLQKACVDEAEADIWFSGLYAGSLRFDSFGGCQPF